jgi:diguanylate cyclase (GGDEF)-like protein/PAS domain S-box-containing protein
MTEDERHGDGGRVRTLGTSNGLFRVIIETSPYLYAVVDDEVRFTYLNAAVFDVLGYQPKELLGTSAIDVIHPEDFELAIGALAQLVDEFDEHPDGGIPMTVRLIRKDGTLTDVELGAIPRRDHPDVRGVIIRGRPVSGQVRLDEALRALVASSPLDDVLEYLVTSVEHELRGGRAAIAHGWNGTTFESVISSSLPPDLCGIVDPARPLSDDDSLDAPWAMALTRRELTAYAELDQFPSGLRALAEDEGLQSCWAMPVSVRPDNAQLACIIVWREQPGVPFVSHRVSLDRASQLTSLAFERRHTEDLLRHAAQHDGLTGIPNRSQFFKRLEAATNLAESIAARDVELEAEIDFEIASAAAGATMPSLVAVLYLDLDGFKPINDTYGHRAGDEHLRAVTDRIAATIRPEDLVARLGGDEFAVLCAGVGDAGEATGVADRLIKAVGEPIDLGGVTVTVGLSVGVAVGVAGVESGATLLDAADKALYEAKHAGKGRWHLAEPLSHA